jgi:hypothetical protein
VNSIKRLIFISLIVVLVMAILSSQYAGIKLAQLERAETIGRILNENHSQVANTVKRLEGL